MCNQKYWKKDELFIKRIELVQHIEKEVDAETPANVTNEANNYVCEYCGCDNCGEPILLHECSRCKATLCYCHLLIENHNCVPIERGWNEYTKWQEKLR